MTKRFPIFESSAQRYIGTGVLGAGGECRIYEAKTASGDLVALKFLPPERATASRRKRFSDEVHFCQQLKHKNIIQVLDQGNKKFRGVVCPFYVMPKYTGTLLSIMDDLNPEDVLPVFAQILDGVEQVHRSGAWHLDIKPMNILWSAEMNRLILADFGTVSFQQDDGEHLELTSNSSFKANFRYSAPEQRTPGAAIDHRADIYSLGLLLNELFTGETPKKGNFKTIAEFSAEYGYVDKIVAAMIEQNPEERPKSIAEVRNGLKENSVLKNSRVDKSGGEII